MHAKYEDQTCEAVLLVDVSNANNSIKKKCTKIAICVKTVTHSWFSITGGYKIRLCEETTQGNSVAIAIP